MASTPSSRIKPTPSNSPFPSRPSRSPIRARTLHESCLSLQRVVGTTCSSPTGFDTVYSSFAYIAGGAVVVVDVSGEHYSQRFYRARPSAVPLLSVSPVANASSTPSSTPKANDSRNRAAAAAASPRETLHASSDWPESSPTSKTWTSRERIKAATCLALSRDGRYLAVGETGYAPRVLIFNLQDASSDIPLVSISEHTFGVKAVAWSPDTKYLASLGSANDGFLYLWKVDPRTGAVKLFQQNRCTSFVKEMVWVGSTLITLGVRHVKAWRVDDGQTISPTKAKFPEGQAPAAPPQAQKPLAGRNILLGSMLDATFCCALPVGDDKAIICSETGCVCLLDDEGKQMKLTKVLDLGFNISCISSRKEDVHVGGKDGQFAVINIQSLLTGVPDPTVRSSQMADGLVAMGFLAENLVTIDNKRSIDVWSPDYIPAVSKDDSKHIPIPGPGDPIVGIQRLSASNNLGAAFFTWSGSGKLNIWDMDGMIKSSFDIPIEQSESANESEPVNQVVVVRATNDGNLFFIGDKLGVLRIIDISSGECLLETKAHSSNCQAITIHEGKSRVLMASCGRDRTVQLFHRSSAGMFEHFQTLEFSARVVQVLIPTEDKILTCSLDRTLQIHDLVSKEGEPDVMAAISLKIISLRASPSSMTVTPDVKAIFVSLLDRSICQFDFSSGRLSNSFKCNDEAGIESVVLESLTYGHLSADDPSFILGISNTDKSVRIYDAQSGSFIHREWGHTEAIKGVVLADGDENGRKVVSVGEDGTIMLWALEFQDSLSVPRTRDPSPEKITPLAANRPPLRRVLSKAELAEFQRPSSATPSDRRSSRSFGRRASKFQLPLSSLRTPTTDKQISTSSATPAAVDGTPSRRASSGGGSPSDSPPPEESPKNHRSRMFRRPSLPALDLTPSSASKSIKSRKASNSNLRGGGQHSNHNSNKTGNHGFGSLSMATEQTCRQLRAYRKKLATSSAEINDDLLTQLDAELRLTAGALGERAIRTRSSGGGGRYHQGHHHHSHTKAVSESVLLEGLLDQYSERLVSMLDEKLRLRLSEDDGRERETEKERPRTAGEGSLASGEGCSGDGDGDGDGESTTCAGGSEAGGGGCEEGEG
ncbi:Mitogen-activated protein kinase-binding protein 1 [Madurella mycetomatis]|uniref:Mitogen-activated protein kinase-binding protein 1 n=1 Tax=Madurella mycetomatis TaxID=100816 RepID=A0A175WAJ2_9PEZI|nr:Mitogen-activated protein kinase-binding protein 1 [Madurella mycetomatis]